MIRGRPYGYRARIGYTSPPLTGEVFPYEFYRLAPAGVSLVITAPAVTVRADADTIMFPSPHRPVIEAIQPLEDEFGIPVMSSIQAIVREAPRSAGIDDPIEGYGRLLREL